MTLIGALKVTLRMPAGISEAHRAALGRKDPAFYGPIFPEVDPALPYFWPV